jgi:hypothetical protein
VMGTVEGLPKYVCTQTIDRARYEPDGRYVPDSGTHRMHSCDSLAAKVHSAAWKRQLSSLDRLRLDVAVTHNRLGLDTEMYSWAGEEHFSDRWFATERSRPAASHPCWPPYSAVRLRPFPIRGM